MFPAETWSEIGAWLGDYDDFSNLAVALGVKWNPATQAQRMIRKYGKDFLRHVPIGDELAHWDSGPTRTKRQFIEFSPQQMDFYRFVTRRMIKYVEEPDDNPNRVHWWQMEAFLHLGTRVGLFDNPGPRWIESIMEYEPAVVELLLHNGVLGDHNMNTLDTFFQYSFDATFHCSWVCQLIRWGIPMDLDALLVLAVEYTTRQYEPLEIDRICRFDPQTQFQVQTFIQRLLEFGADPNALVGVKTPTDPGVTEILLEHGADPDALGWPPSNWIWDSEKDRISAWCQYGWLPTVDDVDLYFFCLMTWKRWDLVDAFLRHYKRDLVLVIENKGLKLAIEARQLDVVKYMVRLCPEILREIPWFFSSIVDWYAESDWKLDVGLIEMVLSAGCLVDRDDVYKCIEGNQRDIARWALFQPKLFRWPRSSRVKDGPAWAPKLIDDLMHLVFRVDRGHYRYRFEYYGDFGKDVCRKCFE